MFLYEQVEGAWVASLTLGPEPIDDLPLGNARYGSSVALTAWDASTSDPDEARWDGEMVLVVGAPRGPDEPRPGAVYTYARLADDDEWSRQWSRQSTIQSVNPVEEDSFGWSVALAGNGELAAIGARGVGAVDLY